MKQSLNSALYQCRIRWFRPWNKGGGGGGWAGVHPEPRSLLSMRCMLLRYSLEPWPNSRALGTAGSVMLIDLSIKGCSHSKKPLWQKKNTRLTSPEVRAAVTSEVWGDSGSTSFSLPHWRRQKEALFAGYIWHKAAVLCRTGKLLSTSATPFSISIILHIILSLIQ